MTLEEPPHSGRLQMGGTLRDDTLYIERPEDERIYELLHHGRPCHIAGARQMGKSSLLARLQGRLVRSGVRILSVDLSSVAPTRVEQDAWFQAVLSAISLELDGGLSRFERWWHERPRGDSMTARVLAFAEDFLLATRSSMVVILDEIETTLDKDFTDDLFVAIRTLYQGRDARPELRQLTFCLAGNVEASALIKASGAPAFDMATTIRLTDFSRLTCDLTPLDAFLEERGLPGKALVDEILSWTSGHPFLTMALCNRVSAVGTHDIEELVRSELERSRGFSVHLTQLGAALERQLANDPSLLDAYADIVHERSGTKLPQNIEDELVRVGLLKREGGSVRLRNRIYALCLGEAWLLTKQPGGVLQTFSRAFARVWNKG